MEEEIKNLSEDMRYCVAMGRTEDAKILFEALKLILSNTPPNPKS